MKGMSCGLKHHRQPLAARSRHRQVQTEQLHENTKVQCEGKKLGEGGERKSVQIETLFTQLSLLFHLLLWFCKLNQENILCKPIM